MARIIKSSFSPILTAVIQTIKTDGTVESMELKENDKVTDLRYVADGEIIKVSGRVSDFVYDVSNKPRKYNTAYTAKSYFSTDVTLETILIDVSKEYDANVIMVTAREIVENESVKNVERMKYYLKYGCNFEIKLSDNTTNKFTLQEGEFISGLTYLSYGKEITTSGKLIAIDHNRYLVPTKLIVMVDNNVRVIPVTSVKGIGKTVPAIPVGSSLNDAIKATTDGFISVGAGTFSDNLTIENDIVIYGARSGVSASSKYGIASTEPETVISGAVKVSGGASITLDGVTLTGNALLNLSEASSVTLKNCKILGVNPIANKTFLIRTNGGSSAKIVIKNCYFGLNPVIEADPATNAKFSIYNLMELTGTLKDGSEFTNNYFEASCSNHNDINIYSVEDGATVTIKGNIWEKSTNAIRLGIKGEPTCTINIIDNTYMTTEAEKEYAGLLLIQPYGKETTSMANTTVNITKTQYTGPSFKDGTYPQTYYMYAGKNDMQFTEENVPTIVLDGKTVSKPVKK